ncbi:tail fiber assembly protein [Aeromonas caviae]|uniref:tail fiber assembly protein n=1 Tax=Aeromonas caviae TaxID=648 RepID=UPI003F74ABF6
MKALWSPSVEGIFMEGVSSNIPSDATPVTTARYDQLMQEVTSHPLNTIRDENGKPKVVLSRTAEENAAIANESKRQRLLNEAIDKIALLQPAVDGGYATPDDTAALPQWQRYRYELFQMDRQPDWPASPQWPAEPEHII